MEMGSQQSSLFETLKTIKIRKTLWIVTIEKYDLNQFKKGF